MKAMLWIALPLLAAAIALALAARSRRRKQAPARPARPKTSVAEPGQREPESHSAYGPDQFAGNLDAALRRFFDDSGQDRQGF